MIDVSERGLAFVAAREACVLTAYRDSHMLAIGFGQNDPNLKEGDTTTLEHAIALFRTAAFERVVALRKIFAGVDLPQHQFDALFSLLYNCGAGTIARNSPDLLGAVRAYRANPKDVRFRDHAAYQIILTHPEDKPVPFNLSRRCREVLLFLSEDYGDISTLKFWPAGKSPKHTPPDLVTLIPMPKFRSSP